MSTVSDTDRYRRIFDAAAVSIWEEDFSAAKAALDRLRQGVADLGTYLRSHPEFIEEAVRLVRVLDVNQATLAMFEATSKEELLPSLGQVFVPETLSSLPKSCWRSLRASRFSPRSVWRAPCADGPSI